MARRISPSEQRKRRAVRNSVLAISTSVVVLLVVGWGLVQGELEPELNPKTYCEIGGADSVTVAIIDVSQPYNLVQQKEISGRIEAVRDDLLKNHKLVVYLLDESSDELPEPDFEGCNPGKEANWLYQNERLMIRQWERAVGRLNVVIDEIIPDRTGRPSSPLMEMTQVVSVKEFGIYGSDRPLIMKLLLISDMIQNTDGYSQYGGHSTAFESFRRSDYFKRVRADLRDVEVQILYVRRDQAGKIQTDEFLEFWRAYFREGLGAPSIRITRVTG